MRLFATVTQINAHKLTSVSLPSENDSYILRRAPSSENPLVELGFSPSYSSMIHTNGDEDSRETDPRHDRIKITFNKFFHRVIAQCSTQKATKTAEKHIQGTTESKLLSTNSQPKAKPAIVFSCFCLFVFCFCFVFCQYQIRCGDEHNQCYGACFCIPAMV